MNVELAPKETEIQAIWDDARLYCFALNIDGKTGWRLPTIDELNEIHESENDFEERYWYWSSTEDNGYGAWAQWVCGTGGQASFYKSLDSNYVRAVRDLKDN